MHLSHHSFINTPQTAVAQACLDKYTVLHIQAKPSRKEDLLKMSNQTNTNQQQPGLVAGHAEYIKGAAQVNGSFK
jgi:3-dehydroquinate dehydratase